VNSSQHLTSVIEAKRPAVVRSRTVRQTTRISVIVPSCNRAQVLHDTILSILRQQLSPARVLVSVPDPAHVENRTLALPKIQRVLAPLGLAAQRNAAIEQLDDSDDLVAFFDDDVELAPDYLLQAARAFASSPSLCLLTGQVLSDGVRTGGIERQAAREAICFSPARTSGAGGLHPVPSAYGCNMVVRRAALSRVRFDERLPLYGWLEDRDFSHWCHDLGEVVRCSSCRMVHLGVKPGRVSGRRYGFSQIMNSYYLLQKGSVGLGEMLVSYWGKPVAANLVGSLMPAREIDRRGRLIGNLTALWHLARARVEPEYVLQIS
jgi:GT2 family glycosyltransferase